MSGEILQTIPNVGPAIAEDRRRLGLESPSDLEGAEAERLYDRLCQMDDERHDPCVRDVLAAAIHYVETGEELHWSMFSQQRHETEET